VIDKIVHPASGTHEQVFADLEKVFFVHARLIELFIVSNEIAREFDNHLTFGELPASEYRLAEGRVLQDQPFNFRRFIFLHTSSSRTREYKIHSV